MIPDEASELDQIKMTETEELFQFEHDQKLTATNLGG